MQKARFAAFTTGLTYGKITEMPASLNTVFLTNNGLGDHIGISQVFPYLEGLARRGHSISVISMESRERERQIETELLPRLRDTTIEWHPIWRSKNRMMRRAERPFTASRMYRKLRVLAERAPIDLLHCRSYMPLSSAIRFSQERGIPLLFDMRGFWIDQRIEAGEWNEGSLVSKRVIAHFRKFEERAIAHSTSIVTLTHDAGRRVAEHPAYNGAHLFTIACSVDLDRFRFDQAARTGTRAALGVNDNDTVLIWLGSAGSVYRFDAALRLLDTLNRRSVPTKLLLLGNHSVEATLASAAQLNIALDPGWLRCEIAAHDEVPAYLSAGDVGLSLIQPTSSSIGVSATKTGEYLSCGLPVISNAGVGDIDRILPREQVGHVLPDFSASSIENASRVIEGRRFGSRDEIARHAASLFDMDRAIDSFDGAYHASAA